MGNAIYYLITQILESFQQIENPLQFNQVCSLPCYHGFLRTDESGLMEFTTLSKDPTFV